MTSLTFTIPRRKLALALGIVATCLCLLSISLKALEWELGTNSTYWYYHTVQLFNVNREGNIPTWYSSLLLLTCFLLLLTVTQIKRKRQGPYRWHWLLLALVFLYLTIDEAAALHEKLTIPFQENESLNVRGYVYFAWVLVGVPFVLFMGLVYARFLFHLPAQTRRHFVLAAVLYIGGAVVIESISANQWYLNDGTSLTFSAIGTLEEFCEMSGAIVFIYGLLTYVNTYVEQVELRLTA